MPENNSTPPVIQPEGTPIPRAADEAGSIYVSGFVKVFDPNTQQILVEVRE